MSEPQRASETTSRQHLLDGSAPSTVEYAIIAVLIAAIAVGTWKTFGEYREGDLPAESTYR